ncbi:MAG: hypothetical protein H6708_10175 [Kofleriaceae bacterium]|nr:hypothetical protein [Myxococcales bacterium]MCB9560760.1 hypothetical protein [Kofleriaceae bacterium]
MSLVYRRHGSRTSRGLGIALVIATSATIYGCGDPAPDGVLVELSPDLISSIDGTTTVRAMVIEERTPLENQPVRVSVAYTDRNGVEHAVDPVDGTTDVRGAFEATIEGLTWEGTGTVTAEVLDASGQPVAIDGVGVAGAATFAVIDRTPPQVEILPPTTDLHVGPGLPIDVQVRVQDEIGVAEIFFEADGEASRQRSTVVASGSTDATVTFRVDVPNDANPGPTITLYALASDLSGNQAAAEPVVLIVDPAIAIATPPGLDGALITDGTQQALDDPRAIAVSPMDGKIYVADNSGGACNGACIRQIDPADGSVSATVVMVGQGDLEGVAFDQTGANLYYSDRQDRLGRMAWNAGTMRYENATICNNVSAQNPQSPYHLVVDPTLGVVVADDDRQRLLQLPDCTQAQPTSLSNQGLDSPRGVARGAAGEFYVSDDNRDTVYKVDRTTGAVTSFEDRNLNQPYGLEWLAGGTSEFADSLMIAERGDRLVVSSRGDGTRAVAYLRNNPVDVAIAGGTMYILTRPSANNRGRVFAVTGF